MSEQREPPVVQEIAYPPVGTAGRRVLDEAKEKHLRVITEESDPLRVWSAQHKLLLYQLLVEAAGHPVTRGEFQTAIERATSVGGKIFLGDPKLMERALRVALERATRGDEARLEDQPIQVSRHPQEMSPEPDDEQGNQTGDSSFVHAGAAGER